MAHASGEVHFYHVAGLDQRFDRPRRSDEDPVGTEPHRYVAVLPRDQPSLRELPAALRHAPCRGRAGHRLASPSCTMRPLTMVSRARPVSRRPPNGVLRLFETKAAGVTVHGVVQSSTHTSAGAPAASVPPGRWKTFAGR